MIVPPFIPSVKANPDSITYSAGVITVDGTYTDVFEDIYQADQAGGWDVFTKTGNNAYACNGIQIDFGDGENETVAADSACSVNFFNGAWGTAFRVRNNATATFGTLLNTERKSTANGVSFIIETYGYVDLAEESTTNFYGCSLMSNQAVELDLSGDGNIYNSLFSSGYDLFCFYDTATYNLFNVYSSNDADVLWYLTDCPLVTFDTIYAFDSPYLFYIDTSNDLTLTNIAGGGATTDSLFVSTANSNIYLVNPTLDSWTLDITSSIGDKVYRQYTYDLTIQFLNTSKTENANVTITNTILDTSDSWLTPANGSIPQQTYSYGHYNQTGGDSLYDYNPYNLTITYPDYQTYTALFNLTEKTDWTITLTKETDGNGGYAYFAPAFLLAFLIGLALMIVWIKK